MRHLTPVQLSHSLCIALALRSMEGSRVCPPGTAELFASGHRAFGGRVSLSWSQMANLGAQPQLLGLISSHPDWFHGKQSATCQVRGDLTRALCSVKNQRRPGSHYRLSIYISRANSGWI